MKFGLWHATWWRRTDDEPPASYPSFEKAHEAAAKLNREWPEEHWEARELQPEPWKHTADRACPCLHMTPCHPRCTCVMAVSSSGCRRCCSYGSEEQQKAMAKHLAEREELLRDVIDTFYMGDDDKPCWAETGLGARIASHLGLKK